MNASLPAGAVAVQWLRRTHGWFGLWGAVLGLVFGFAGIWLNHRAVMKLPMAQERQESRIALESPPPATPQEMAEWLRTRLGTPRDANTKRTDPARKLPWRLPDGTNPVQPERWQFTFGGPDLLTQAEWWRGNDFVNVTTTRNGFVATLANLHKGVAMPVAWLLLVDAFAGCILFLSASGVALWVLTHRRRGMAALSIFGVSLAAAGGLILSRV
jgi:hypothetical protein